MKLPWDGILLPGDFMNNIPIFMSQGGTATLILQEIPHKRTAYILLRTTLPESLQLMIDECAAFCRDCGAEHCFVAAPEHDTALPGPRTHTILRMTVNKSSLPLQQEPFFLKPITPDNDSIYQRIYNRCFQQVSNAVTYDRAQIQRIYREKQQAFLALTPDSTPCGIGELHGNVLAAVGLLPEYRGHGRDLVLELLQHCPGPEITLTVASDNPAALKIYQSLGFAVTGTESVWYRC